VPLADELPEGIQVRLDERIPHDVALVGNAERLRQLLDICRSPITFERLSLAASILNSGRAEPVVQVVRV
jgi:hypothetical protein